MYLWETVMTGGPEFEVVFSGIFVFSITVKAIQFTQVVLRPYNDYKHCKSGQIRNNNNANGKRSCRGRECLLSPQKTTPIILPCSAGCTGSPKGHTQFLGLIPAKIPYDLPQAQISQMAKRVVGANSNAKHFLFVLHGRIYFILICEGVKLFLMVVVIESFCTETATSPIASREGLEAFGDCRACKVNTNQPTTHPPKPPAPRGWLPKPLRPGHAIVQKLGLDEVSVCGSRGALIWKNEYGLAARNEINQCHLTTQLCVEELHKSQTQVEETYSLQVFIAFEFFAAFEAVLVSTTESTCEVEQRYYSTLWTGDK
ncbi:hypothetical protein Q9966_015493 [Columba livia]|nr:hypothetical protein Q9966_015493 [Columba livia]